MQSTFDNNLPGALGGLYDLAYNLYWSWNHQSDQIWTRINEDVWLQTHNPVQVLQATSQEKLTALSSDVEFVNQLNAVLEKTNDYLAQAGWYGQEYADKSLKGIAYFSMEFGLCEALPLYAGGLGILAGDYLKTASDLAVPLVAVGLFYQQGYFHQQVDKKGWQHESYLFNEPTNLPAQPLLTDDGNLLYVEIELAARKIYFKVWKVNVGRIPLYLLDSNDSRNSPYDRNITSRLYPGGNEWRLLQEVALGIGGWRLIHQLGLSIDVCHLNEGHAAFAALERIRHYCERYKVDFWQGLWGTRIANLFTTHTAVASGFDHYPPLLVKQYIGDYAAQCGVSAQAIIHLGRANPEDENEPFNMAYLALRTCAHCNGVSQLHGEISRQIFQPLFPRWPSRDIRIGHITNGIHVPTWDSRWADDLWTASFGKPRWRGGLNSTLPAQLDQISDESLCRLSAWERQDLVLYIRQRLQKQTEILDGHLGSNYCLSLDPNILTLGFARRFAEYKRGDLLLMQPDRFAKLLNNERYPLQIIVAGKAHPNDDIGKRAIQRWFQFIHDYELSKRVVFIEDYDIDLAQQLVRGVDLWVNTPRRPWEACGTSGMKVLVNGGLNISTLDGWWGEACSAEVGWSFGGAQTHGWEDDIKDAGELYQLLENEIIPLFYSHNSKGIAPGWLKRVRASMSQLTTRFSSNRMIKDYLDCYYFKAAHGIEQRTKNACEIAKELQLWDKGLRQSWHEIHIENVNFQSSDQGYSIEAHVYLGSINAQSIRVQVIADPTDRHPAVIINLDMAEPIENAINSFHFCGQLITARDFQDFTLRVIPWHSDVQIPAENSLIYWQIRG